jgi:hypothetical protein
LWLRSTGWHARRIGRKPPPAKRTIDASTAVRWISGASGAIWTDGRWRLESPDRPGCEGLHAAVWRHIPHRQACAERCKGTASDGHRSPETGGFRTHLAIGRRCRRYIAMRSSTGHLPVQRSRRSRPASSGWRGIVINNLIGPRRPRR